MRHYTRRWLTVVLFVSSYAPLGVILVIRDYFGDTWSFKHPRTVLVVGMLVVVSIFVLVLTMKNVVGESQVRVVSVGNRSNDLTLLCQV